MRSLLLSLFIGLVGVGVSCQSSIPAPTTEYVTASERQQAFSIQFSTSYLTHFTRSEHQWFEFHLATQQQIMIMVFNNDVIIKIYANDNIEPMVVSSKDDQGVLFVPDLIAGYYVIELILNQSLHGSKLLTASFFLSILEPS